MTGPLAPLFAQVRTVVPSTEEIERRMSQAQAVLDDPDEYPREYFGDARREITRCERLRAIDAALSSIERHVQDMEKALEKIAFTTPANNAQGNLNIFREIAALALPAREKGEK